jgi:hypothetical protein
MKTRKRCLPPALIPADSRLAESITSANGVVLMAAGALLDEGQLANLVRRGVEAVTIEEDDPRAAADIAAEIAAAEARIDTIFADVADDPTMLALKHAVLAYRRQALA